VGAAAQDRQDAGGQNLRVGRVEACGRRHRADFRAGTATGAAVENFGHLNVVCVFER
jgi:hypothetical protein